MGEDTQWIFNHGSPAVDGLADIPPAENAPDLLVMQHPVGGDDQTERQRMSDTLLATAKFKRLVLPPNHDPGRDGITQAIADHGIETGNHLPRRRFIALLKGAKLIVGNSSAGLIEAAVCRTPAVNIGPRQGGRETPNSVVSCAYGKRQTAQAIKQALQLDHQKLRHPYGRGRAGQAIADTLASIKLDTLALHKRNRY